MFGARVNELHLLIKALMNIERTVVDLDHEKKKNNNNNTQSRVHRNCESSLARSNMNTMQQHTG